MQRRELLRLIASLTGVTFIGRHELIASPDSDPSHPYTQAEVACFDEVAETILPKTDTPGAKEAGVGAFMARYSAACYSPAHIALMKSGVIEIESKMRQVHGTSFLQARMADKVALLTEIDRDAKEQVRRAGDNAKDSPHYFTLMKQLTLFGFFTSEPGATQVCRYRPIPGRYQGCVPYRGETFWAW
jgi:hypothetical protein